MGEVAEMFDVNQSLIRHWEKQFDVLRPKRNKKGNRLFTPQDVENLKLIYHLVKERGMTLEGARKALRRHRADSAVPRDAELMERLQRIRSLLVEVREQLKEEPAGEVYSDSEADHEPAAAETPEPQPTSKTPPISAAPVAPAVPVVAEEAADTVAAEPEVVAAEPAVGSAPVGEPAVEPVAAAGAAETVAAAESDAGDSTEEPANDAADPEKAARAGNGGESGTGTGTAKRPRRKKDDDDNHELFAFYEQSLF